MKVVAGAAVVAALSLLLPQALAFDPWAWLVWGRDAGRLALDTTTGPSWKPLPVLFTTLFAPFGGAAPELWAFVARLGGVFGLIGAYVLGERLAGRWAGAAAACAMALSPWWLYNTALGNTEGLLAAAVLWAVIAHLDGHSRAALACATAAALMRPEAWPFLLIYGAWLWRSDRRAVLVAGALVPLLWFGPDVIGVGGALGASHTARGVPSPGSAKLADVPPLAVLGDTATILTLPALAFGVLAAVLMGGLARRIALGAFAWVAIVAAMTAAGYAGNPRYLVAAAALGAVLAGAGAVRAATAIAVRLAPGARFAAPLGAAALVALMLAVSGGKLGDQLAELSHRADADAAFAGVIARAGGRDALVDCAKVRTSVRARSLVAWRLDLPLRDLDQRPEPPALVIRAKWFYGQGLEPGHEPGYRTLARSAYWAVDADCDVS